MMFRNTLLFGLLSVLSVQLYAADCLTRHEMDNPDHMYNLPDQANDQLVEDLETALTWTRCPLGYDVVAGACTANASPSSYTWVDALAAADASNTAIYEGHSDWRVPSIKELQTIMAPTCKNRAMNELAFPVMANDFIYSSTPDVKAVNNVFMVRTSDGQALISGSGAARMVYLVRGINP